MAIVDHVTDPDPEEDDRNPRQILCAEQGYFAVDAYEDRRYCLALADRDDFLRALHDPKTTWWEGNEIDGDEVGIRLDTVVAWQAYTADKVRTAQNLDRELRKRERMGLGGEG